MNIVIKIEADGELVLKTPNGDKPLTPKPATNTELGSIKTGHVDTDTTTAVKLDSENRAYVEKDLSSEQEVVKYYPNHTVEWYYPLDKPTKIMQYEWNRELDYKLFLGTYPIEEMLTRGFPKHIPYWLLNKHGYAESYGGVKVPLEESSLNYLPLPKTIKVYSDYLKPMAIYPKFVLNEVSLLDDTVFFSNYFKYQHEQSPAYYSIKLFDYFEDVFITDPNVQIIPAKTYYNNISAQSISYLSGTVIATYKYPEFKIKEKGIRPWSTSTIKINGNTVDPYNDNYDVEHTQHSEEGPINIRGVLSYFDGTNWINGEDKVLNPIINNPTSLYKPPLLTLQKTQDSFTLNDIWFNVAGFREGQVEPIIEHKMFTHTARFKGNKYLKHAYYGEIVEFPYYEGNTGLLAFLPRNVGGMNNYYYNVHWGKSEEEEIPYHSILQYPNGYIELCCKDSLNSKRRLNVFNTSIVFGEYGMELGEGQFLLSVLVHTDYKDEFLSHSPGFHLYTAIPHNNEGGSVTYTRDLIKHFPLNSQEVTNVQVAYPEGIYEVFYKVVSINDFSPNGEWDRDLHYDYVSMSLWPTISTKLLEQMTE